MDYTGFRQIIYQLTQDPEGFVPWFFAATRIILVLFSLLIVIRCAISLLKGKNWPEVWGVLEEKETRHRHPVKHWENLLGRSPSCDVLINYPTVSRNHGALIRDDKGEWEIYDTMSKSGTRVNGVQIDGQSPVQFGDTVNIGGIEMTLDRLTDEEKEKTRKRRVEPGSRIKQGGTLVLLTIFQIILVMQLILSAGPSFDISIPIVFGALCVMMWVCNIINRSFKRRGFEIETLAFYMTTIGMCVAASATPEELYKQMVAVVIGIVFYYILCFVLRDLKRAKVVRWPAAIIAVGTLGFTALFGTIINGAKNWIEIAGISIQPSEFVKVVFIYAGAATLDRLLAKRNLILFIVFTALCMGLLAYMGDFGAALIFFVTFVAISFMRSGNIFTVFLCLAGAVFAAFLAITAMPYIAERFATWGHAWEYAFDSGYQQTRTMSAAAGGGLFGMGAGRGWLRSVFAADTDLVFGVVCEELGLIIALSAVACIIIMAVFVVKSARQGRSSFYVIAAGAAVTLMVVQSALNVLGSVDIIPLTGVTLPFVSNGGSSIVASFGMLAFIKATDTRKNSSLAIRREKNNNSDNNNEDNYEYEDFEDYGIPLSEYSDGDYREENYE